MTDFKAIVRRLGPLRNADTAFYTLIKGSALLPASFSALKSERDRRNFTHADWMQARRSGRHPHEIQRSIEDAWAVSDSKVAFIHAMEDCGFKVARGTRRSFVAVDLHGEVYAIARKAGVKTKEVRARLGDEANYPSIEDVKAQFAHEMLPNIKRYKDEIREIAQQQRDEFESRRLELVKRQRRARADLTNDQEKRRTQEAQKRQARFRKGLGGIWDRLRGEHKRIKQRNAEEAEAARLRDTSENHDLVTTQLKERRNLNHLKLSLRREYMKEIRELEYDKQRFEAERQSARDGLTVASPRRGRTIPVSPMKSGVPRTTRHDGFKPRWM